MGDERETEGKRDMGGARKETDRRGTTMAAACCIQRKQKLRKRERRGAADYTVSHYDGFEVENPSLTCC
ncbi:hypothetical protein CIPAW_15G181900 [Carya illinoinensis]|uniref:Uncharacterized protein n=1 Tax=Carya illinoinensis TaxID=32201 RepID=A0A8T1NGD8_CARIL|nr:hypothetical protein CIPAW_15G181900 [Carya illinoinensis]